MAGPDWPTFAIFQQHADVRNDTDLDNVNMTDLALFTQSVFRQHTEVPESVYQEIDKMLRSSEGFSHPSFCVLPFYGIEYPAKTPCCLLPSAISPEQIDDIKFQMLQGQRPTACNKCWSLEENGLTSDRLIKNETLNMFTDLEQLIADCQQGKNKVIHYKIDTSNTCNSACVTCDGIHSNTWNKLLKKNNLPTQVDWKILPNQTTDWVDYASAKLISFRGGEPLLSDTNFYMLEQLIAHNNTDCNVNFVTNGSFSLSKHQKEILSKFKNLNFCFSVDGVGPVFEYVRWPLKWTEIEDNIAWCRSQNVSVGVSYTLSNVNLFYHDATIKWFNDHGIDYLINPVYYPAHFRPQSLSAAIKQQMKEQSNSGTIDQWLSHSIEDEEQYEKFRVELHKQDSMKNINMRDYLPELAELLKW